MIVTFDDKTTSIAMISFPAVTICPTQKSSDEEAEKMFDIFARLDEDDMGLTNILPEEYKLLYYLHGNPLNRINCLLFILAASIA